VATLASKPTSHVSPEKAEAPSRKATMSLPSTDQTQPNRPSIEVNLEVQIMWDQGEDATPGMQLPSNFTCGQWTSLPAMKGDQEYFGKRRQCTARVTRSGSAKLLLDTSLGKVYVTYRYQVDGHPMRGADLHWVKKGITVEVPIDWELQ
jgi:hypothetical protein